MHANKISMPRRRREVAVTCRLDELLSPRLFKALSDPSRLGLLVRLAEARGPRTVGEVARGTDIDLSVVSRHLGILRGAGVIECVKRGKEVWCSIRTSALAQLLRDLADAIEVCCPAGEPPSAGGESGARGKRNRLRE